MTDFPDDDLNEMSHDEDGVVAGLSRLAGLIRRIDWFGNIGTPLDKSVYATSQDYVESLGFPGTYISEVEDWEDAMAAAESHDLNTQAWEVEEQLRSSLTEQACSYFEEDYLSNLLQSIESVAVQVMDEAAAEIRDRHHLTDERFLTAAVGAGVQICHLAALVLIVEDEDRENHPFFHKFRLFEAGRWPIGITGSSFNIF